MGGEGGATDAEACRPVGGRCPRAREICDAGASCYLSACARMFPTLLACRAWSGVGAWSVGWS